MASTELRKLHKLHLIDLGLTEVRKRAAALDPGRRLAAELDSLTKAHDEVAGTARSLQSELTDLELLQKGIGEKLQKIEKEIYGGKLVSPREVENRQKEIEILKRQRSDKDGRILEIWDELPSAQAAAEAAAKAMEAKQTELEARRKAAIAEKKALEAEYARLQAARPEALQGIPPSLLARYEAVRAKTGDTGMADLVKGKSCGGCGTTQPTRTIETLKEDKLATCESCRRILYYTEGVI